MKDCASCVAFRAVLAAGLVVFGFGFASAADRTWTGAAGDGKWSTAGNWSGSAVPASGDAVIFNGTATSPNSIVDADFAGTVYNLTLSAGYSGTLSLARDLRVRGKYIQNAGTFNGGYASDEFELWVGTADSANPPSGFELSGGTFNAPKMLRWSSKKNGASSFKNLEAGTFNANGGTVFFDAHSSYQVYLYSVNKVYNNVIFGGATTGGLTFNAVSNNRITGSMVHNGAFISMTGTCEAFIVEGDISVLENANGGKAKFLLSTAENQTISFGEPTVGTDGYEYGRAASFVVDKPEGKAVTVTSVNRKARFGCGTSKYDVWSGINVVSGLFDLSACTNMSAYAGGSRLTAYKGESIVFPESVSFTAVWKDTTYYGIDFDQPKGDTFTFHDLALCGVYTPRLRASTTNLVNGTLTIDGAGPMSSTDRSGDYSDTSTGWVEGTSQKLATIAVKGDIYVKNDCGLTDAKYYGGTALTVVCGENDQHLYYTGGALGSLVVDKKEGSKLVCHTDGAPMELWGWNANNSGCVAPHLIIHSGELVFPADGIVMPNARLCSFLQFGGKLTHNNATFGMTGTLKVDLTDPLYGLTIGLNGGTGEFAPRATTQLVVEGPFNGNVGRLGYRSYGNTSRLYVKGNYHVGSGWKGHNTPMTFSGSGVQHVSQAEGGFNHYEATTVAKDGGRLILDTSIDFSKRSSGDGTQVDATKSQNTSLSCGTLDLNGHTLTLPPTGTTAVGVGVRFAFPAAEPEARACVVAADKLLFPTTAGSVELELTGKLTPESPSPISVFGYGSLVKAFDPAVFALVPNPLLSKRFKVTNDGTERLVSLAYAYKRGTLLYVR